MNIDIVLASSSVYRAQLLKKLKLEFTQHSPDIDESPKENEAPESLAKRLSEQKALATFSYYPRSLIIASDQVACNGSDQLFEKPLTRVRAIEQLTTLSGRDAFFHTSLSIIKPSESDNTKPDIVTCLDTTRVLFKQLNDKQIERYVDTEQPFDCAGSFKSEGLGIALFERIEGRDPNALIGLPLMALCDQLENIGIPRFDWLE